MNHERFSIRSKISSNSASIARFCVLVIALLVLTVSCSSRPPARVIPRPLPEAVSAKPQPPPPAPWQVWSSDTLGEAKLKQAEEAILAGKLPEAVELYTQVEHQTTSPVIREVAVMRRAGTLLKQGLSREALENITSFVRNQGKTVQDLSPQMSFIVAFAYLHQGDMNQALAWFGQTYQKAGARSDLGYRTEREVKQLLRGLNQGALSAYESQWRSDPFVGPLLTAEQTRRAQGARPETIDLARWFIPSTYLPRAGATTTAPPPDESILESDITAPAPVDGEFSVGLLLPLSGRFAEHGRRVKEGIELAVDEFTAQGGRVRVVVADSAGEPDIAAREYANLVQREGVSFVFGPLLVKTAIAVAEQSRALGVPVMTFTKREGIPAMSPAVFRLGATARDQAQELVQFAAERHGVTSFATVYPNSETGLELADAFRRATAERGLALNVDVAYHHGDSEGLKRAVQELEVNPPQALFIADSIENAWPVLELLQSSPLRNALILGPAAWDDPVALRGYASLLDGAVFVTPFFAATHDPAVRVFIDRYRERYGHDPGLLGAQGYDAARLLFSALPVPDYRPETLIQGLQTADIYSGVTGKLSVGGDREISRRMSVVRVVNGEPTELMARGEPTGILLDEESNKIGMAQ